MINIKFLQTIWIRNQVERLRELENDLEGKKSLDLLTDSLNLFFKEMYGDDSEEFVFEYWDLKSKR